MNIDNNTLSIVKEYLMDELKPHALFVFGSATKGYFREDSDLDIAFLNDKEIKDYDLYLIAQGLALKIDREVDLVDLRQVDTVFKAQILSWGRVIYSKDLQELAEFRIRTLKEYALLNEERMEILRNIFAKGSVYGG